MVCSSQVFDLCFASIAIPNSVMGIQKPAWLDALYAQKFFAGCSAHGNAKKNEKNVFCLDCCTSICPHCIPSHRLHRLLQIRRYVYHDVVRLEDLQKLIDCSNVQAYTINSAKVVFIKKRPQNRQFKGSVSFCTSCDRSLQEPFIHCSLGCKVDYLLKHKKDLTLYLKKCKTLQLSPDFLYPQDVADDDHNTLNSTIVDSDEPMSDSPGLPRPPRPEVARKKRSSGIHRVCGRFFTNKVASSNNVEISVMGNMTIGAARSRKGIPHRSPFC
ncbi:hypothetical protein MLD38_005676 [Melastoma candidum]|uniref:Uncharacterized protein n=1 Tax=Melastoma candidum TaxID=119954 RepID=A0ACB9RK69_9MYRT|nr:hypothetical protein MLD38_005676 [Melastoma candidum]